MTLRIGRELGVIFLDLSFRGFAGTLLWRRPGGRHVILKRELVARERGEQ